MVYREGTLFKRKKKLGQHFLIDGEVILEIYRELEKINRNTIVIETGAGYGTITQQICKLSNLIIAVEIDRELCRILKSRLRDQENVDIVCTDVLRVKFPKDSIIVGAPPYSITTDLLTKCIIHNVKAAILVLQREVCEKITCRGKKGKFSYLPRFISSFAEISLGREVRRSSFFPQPSVNSQIVTIKVNKRRGIQKNVREEYLAFLRELFKRFKKRKLKEVIKAGLISHETIEREQITKRIFEISENQLIDLFLRKLNKK